MKERNVAAVVLAKGTVNNLPTKPDDLVMVCADTFRNLSAKGRLRAADPKETTAAKAKLEAEEQAAAEAAEKSEAEAAAKTEAAKNPKPRTKQA